VEIEHGGNDFFFVLVFDVQSGCLQRRAG